MCFVLYCICPVSISFGRCMRVWFAMSWGIVKWVKLVYPSYVVYVVTVDSFYSYVQPYTFYRIAFTNTHAHSLIQWVSQRERAPKRNSMQWYNWAWIVICHFHCVCSVRLHVSIELIEKHIHFRYGSAFIKRVVTVLDGGVWFSESFVFFLNIIFLFKCITS